MNSDIPSRDARWKQRFYRYSRAFGKLEQTVALLGQRKLSDLEQEGLVQRFEYTQELSWKLLKDYLEAYGHPRIIGSKDAVRKAINVGLLQNHLQTWLDMIEARNMTAHTYDSQLLGRAVAAISGAFYPALKELHETLPLKLPTNDRQSGFIWPTTAPVR